MALDCELGFIIVLGTTDRWGTWLGMLGETLGAMRFKKGGEGQSSWRGERNVPEGRRSDRTMTLVLRYLLQERNTYQMLHPWPLQV